MKKEMNKSVLEAAMDRLRTVFDGCDDVVVAFSGGKDSGVLLNLALEARAKHAPGHRMGVFHLDYEAQYTATTEYVDAVFAGLPADVDCLRCCVPVRCPTCTSMHEDHWRPWEETKRDLWVRPMPERCLTAEDLPWITSEMTDYGFQSAFAEWRRKSVGAERTCVLVGIRAEESLDRWRTIAGSGRVNRWDGLPWTTVPSPGIVQAYPLYDWLVEDIWTANARFGWTYNRNYDLMHQAGVPLHSQRVASPFNAYAKASLSLYRAIDPDVWGRMVSRVNGVNFTAMYGGTKLMGWRHVQKPAGMTWREYAMFLLDTLPAETAASFRKKLETSVKFWREKGGCLSEETIAELRAAGVELEVGEETNYKTSKRPVRMEYVDETDSRDFQFIPSWKRLCVCILKNDHVGKYMGFSLSKKEMDRRNAILDKYRRL